MDVVEQTPEQTEDAAQVTGEDHKRRVFGRAEEDPDTILALYKEGKLHTQRDVDAQLHKRVGREQEKAEKAKADAERKAREKALQDQEDWKKLAEERTETISERDKRIEVLESVEAERDQAKERTETLEKRLASLIKPQLELVDELYRPFVQSMPVDEQADWLSKNAEKLTSTGQARPAGSRPTGRSAPAPRQENDKEAREAQRLARVSSI